MEQVQKCKYETKLKVMAFVFNEMKFTQKSATYYIISSEELNS